MSERLPREQTRGPDPGLPQPLAMGLGLPAPAAPALAAGADVAGDRRGGAGLRRPAARARRAAAWPRASPCSGPIAGRTRITTSAAWSRTTSRWSGAAGRWSAGSTRRCSPPTAIASGRARSSSTTAWTSWPTSPARRPGLIEAEARLLERADVVFTGGRSLYESKRDRNPNVHCFPSAVESDHFARSLDPDLPLPADLAGLPRPILGYYGVVDERLDYDLIAALADAPGGRLGRAGRAR